MTELEKMIENRFVKKAKAAGWLVYKIQAIGVRGLPDRMCIKQGKIRFIEFKSGNRKLTSSQTEIYVKFLKQRIQIGIFRDADKAMEWLES